MGDAWVGWGGVGHIGMGLGGHAGVGWVMRGQGGTCRGEVG